MSPLHDEVIRVARDLIRLDTTNAREPGLGNETLCAEYLADYLTGDGVEAELVARDAAPGEPGGADPRLPARPRRRVAGVRRAHRRGPVRPTRLDPPAVRGRGRRRRLPLGPRGGRHEERGGGAGGGDGRAGPHRLPAPRRPVVPRRRRRGGRVRGRRDALAARGADRHPAHPQRQRGRRRAAAALRRPRDAQPVRRREGHLPGPGRGLGRGRSRLRARRSAATPYPCSPSCSPASAAGCPSRARHPRPSPCCGCCSGATRATCAAPSPRPTRSTTGSATRSWR